LVSKKLEIKPSMNRHFQLPAYLKITFDKMLTYLKESNEGQNKVLQQRPAQDLMCI